MPRQPGPPDSDSAKLRGVVARIAVAQAGRGVADRFRQFRRGVAGDWSGVDRDGLDVSVDEYDGPLGRGYVVNAVTADGVWRRAVNVGPETRHERAWELTPAEPG